MRNNDDKNNSIPIHHPRKGTLRPGRERPNLAPEGQGVGTGDCWLASLRQTQTIASLRQTRHGPTSG